MNITIEEFRILFSEVVDDQYILTLDFNSNFKDLESWDSFSGLSIISMIDEQFGIAIKAVELANTSSLLELYNLVQEKYKS